MPDPITREQISKLLFVFAGAGNNTTQDLREAGCEILTLGQYLPPTRQHWPVEEFVAPEVFEDLADTIRQMGFREVYSGPYVRSSYHAAETFGKFETTRNLI